MSADITILKESTESTRADGVRRNERIVNVGRGNAAGRRSHEEFIGPQ